MKLHVTNERFNHKCMSSSYNAFFEFLATYQLKSKCKRLVTTLYEMLIIVHIKGVCLLLFYNSSISFSHMLFIISHLYYKQIQVLKNPCHIQMYCRLPTHLDILNMTISKELKSINPCKLFFRYNTFPINQKV